MFRDRPDEWHELPTTKKGLMMIPLTKEACGKHKIAPAPSPHPAVRVLKNYKKKTRKCADPACTAQHS